MVGKLKSEEMSQSLPIQFTDEARKHAAAAL